MTVDTYPDLFWAYTVVWGILAVYIAALGSRLKRIERSLGACGDRPVVDKEGSSC